MNRFEYIDEVSTAAYNVVKRCHEYNEKYDNIKKLGSRDEYFMPEMQCAKQNAALKRAIKEFKYVAGNCEKALQP